MPDPRFDEQGDEAPERLPPRAPAGAGDADDPPARKESAARGPAKPPTVLPRIVYQPPPESALNTAAEPAAKQAKTPNPPQFKTNAKEKPKPPAAPAKTGSLAAQTPESETFEARRRIRMIVGAVCAVSVGLAFFSLWRFLKSSDLDADLSNAAPSDAVMIKPAAAGAARSDAQRDREAKQFLADARRDDRARKPEMAAKRLERLVEAYSGTTAAAQAEDALQRHRQGLPMFPDSPMVIATKAAPRVETSAAATAESADPVVEATEPRPNLAPGNSSAVANAEVTPGAVPPEPHRALGLGMPTANIDPKPLPAGFRSRAAAGVHPSGWPLEITCDRDGAAMVLIPGGDFSMGRDDGEPAQRPAHRVTLSPYYIDQHEIAIRQYNLFLGKPAGSSNSPVTNITHKDAWAYAQWSGKALPTEAQWEMAARTTDGRLFPWGSRPPNWERPRQPKQIDAVMSFAGDLSPYGVFDLAGNAWEWTADVFDTKYFQQFRGVTAVNPTGPNAKSKNFEVVVKGGSKTWDAAWRAGLRPDVKLPYLGFRCVLQVERGAPRGPSNEPAGQPANAPREGGVPF